MIPSFVGNSFRKEFFKMIGLRVRDGGQRTVMMEVSQRINQQGKVKPVTRRMISSFRIRAAGQLLSEYTD